MGASSSTISARSPSPDSSAIGGTLRRRPPTGRDVVRWQARLDRVRLRSDQRHRFEAAPEDLWSALVSVDHFQRWWPWLRRFCASGVQPGDVWMATVQPPLPYRVRFDLLLTEVVAPRLVAVDVTGDVEGAARLEV